MFRPKISSVQRILRSFIFFVFIIVILCYLLNNGAEGGILITIIARLAENIPNFCDGDQMPFLQRMVAAMHAAVLLPQCIVLAILLTACGPLSVEAPVLPESPDISSLPGNVATEVYIIHAGDELEIDFYGDLDLDQAMDVRPDGYISLQLIGEVRADGLTVPELQAVLEERYGEVLSDPRLNVVVRTFSSNVVFIGGDVKQPSAIYFKGKITVLQAISLTGGFDPKTAIIDKVLVIRRAPGKPPQRFFVDLTKIIDGTDLSQDFYLYQYDTIYIKAKE